MVFRRSTYRRRAPAYKRRTPRRRAPARRQYRRSSVRRTSRTRVRVPGFIQPDYTLVKLKDRNTFTTDTGSIPMKAGHVSTISFTVHGSDLFDAFALVSSALTTKPTGFNEWMAFYKYFLVNQSGIQVTPVAIVGNTPNQLPYTMTVTPVTVNSLTTTNISFEEQPYSRTKTFSGSATLQSSGTVINNMSGNQRMQSVSNSAMTKKIMGVKDITDLIIYRGAKLYSPPDMFYWHVTIASLIPWDGVVTKSLVTLPALIMQVRMFYKVQLLDRNTVPDSGEDPESEDEDPAE